MSPQLAGVQLALVTLLLFTCAGSGATWLLARRVLRGLARLPPAVAAARVRWLLLLPIGAGMFMTVVTFIPSVAASVVDVHHHCTSHVGHPHLCVVHLPTGQGSTAGWVALGVAAVITVLRAAPLLRDLRRARRLVSALQPLTPGVRASTLSSREPLCAAVGLWTPIIIVSSAFAEGMGSEALDAAIAHEEAHARRRDALWTSIMRFAALAHHPTVAEELLTTLEAATERACDEQAAAQVGDRLAVADAILRAQRLGLRGWGHLASGFGPAQWAARVEALLAPIAPTPTGLRRWDVVAAAATAVALASAGPIHHAAETALALIAH